VANFKESYEKTMGNEGGYSDSPDDRGGETWCGISRVHNPGWKGWKIIDEQKSIYGPIKPGGEASFTRFVKTGEGHETIETLTGQLYKSNYWDQFGGDGIESQLVANWMFYATVLCGSKLPAQWLQTVLNCLNIESRDLLVDGAIGPATLSALKSAYTKGYEKYILYSLHVQRAGHFIDICQKNESQRQYFRGWLNREMKE
jgi:lysozyme family protein